MARRRADFDMNKLSSAEKIVGGASAVYALWVFVPAWYTGRGSGFHGPTILALLLALAALAGVISTSVGVGPKLNVKPGVLHLGIALTALLLTILGLIVKPGESSVSWGTLLALLISVVWAYGAYMWFSEPEVTWGGRAG